jgi:hypothetical protein
MASLADLQAERERLKAANAKAEFDAALAETCDGKDVLAAGQAVRRLILDALDAAAVEFVSAIAGERDETRVHYLLSEAAHQWGTALGERAAATVAGTAPQINELGDRFRRGVKPRDLLTVSEWAARHRELKSGTNSPGPWHNDLTPYLVEIMDALSEHSSVRQVTFMKSSGVGGTEAMFNWIGYLMHHLGNKDLLCVMPTLELRDRSFNPRLAQDDRRIAGAGRAGEHRQARPRRHARRRPLDPAPPGARGARLPPLGLYSPIGLGFTWAELWQKWEDSPRRHRQPQALHQHHPGRVLGGDRATASKTWPSSPAWRTTPSACPPACAPPGWTCRKTAWKPPSSPGAPARKAGCIDHLILPGDTARPEVWENLPTPCTDAGIAFAAIDSGYNTSMVYAFTEKRRWSRGHERHHRHGPPADRRRKEAPPAPAQPRKKAAAVEPLGVDQGKALLYSRLKLPVPGPGYLHFPQGPRLRRRILRPARRRKAGHQDQGHPPVPGMGADPARATRRSTAWTKRSGCNTPDTTSRRFRRSSA